jgi:hypothetical protein
LKLGGDKSFLIAKNPESFLNKQKLTIYFNRPFSKSKLSYNAICGKRQQNPLFIKDFVFLCRIKNLYEEIRL